MEQTQADDLYALLYATPAPHLKMAKLVAAYGYEETRKKIIQKNGVLTDVDVLSRVVFQIFVDLVEQTQKERS